jgi:predicted nucleic acid-binding protein
VAGEVFVDSGIWYGAANPRLAEHAISVEVLTRAVKDARHLVTTNLVVAEVHAALTRRAHHAAALRFLRSVRRPPHMVVASTWELEERAIRDWIEPYDDQDFSFTDAVSFAVMKERGIEEALALDHHFVVAGFRTRPCWKRSPPRAEYP